VDNVRRELRTEPCVPGPTGGTIKPPVKISDTVVQYPDQLNASGVGGVVILNVLIDTRGDVSDVSVVRSPNPDLEFAAVEAVRQWKYSATTLNCTPVDIHMNVTVAFASQP
jgi:TonB family protein